MSPFAASVFAVLLSFPAWYADVESENERRERLTVVAEAIEAETLVSSGWEPKQVAAVLLALGKHESAWARLVGEGKCHLMPAGADCDAGRARTYYQLHRGACPVVWLSEPGSSEELRQATHCAFARWAGAYFRCLHRQPYGPAAGGFSGYMSASCTRRAGPVRASTYMWVYNRLQNS